jgi:hypothetical protein
MALPDSLTVSESLLFARQIPAHVRHSAHSKIPVMKSCLQLMKDTIYPILQSLSKPIGIPMKATHDSLVKAIDLMEERGKLPQHAHSYHKMTKILDGFFPDGIELKTPEDMYRFHQFCMCVLKLNRYSGTLHKGGHEDTALDLINYAAMLHANTYEKP